MTRQHYLHSNLTHHADWHLFRMFDFIIFNAAQLMRYVQTSVRPVSGLVGLQDPDNWCLFKRLQVSALEASVASLLVKIGQV